MKDFPPRPIVVGAGLSGLLISSALSKAAVPHMLLGDPPTSAPRLGESLSLDASVAFLNFFPDLSSFFFWKKRVVSYIGDYVGSCDLELREFASRTLFKILGYKPIDALLHVDRIGLDSALFEKVVTHPHCHHARARVSHISFDAESDRVEALQLDNGNVLSPTVVFDATNHVRLIGRAAGVNCEMTSPLQRVAFTHLHLADDDEGASEEWSHSTSLLRLYREADGVDGRAWCVPLGRYISIGVSMLADENENHSDEEMLMLVHEAFARRGLDYRRRFVRQHGLLGLKHRYFRHERGWGANWLLAGPSSCQVWWPSSTGVGASMAAANLAAQFTRDPSTVGRLYQTYLNELDPAHKNFTRLMTEAQPTRDKALIVGDVKRLIHGHVVRLCVFAQTQQTGLAKQIGRLLYHLARRHDRANVDCQFRSVRLAEQTAAVYRGGGAAHD